MRESIREDFRSLKMEGFKAARHVSAKGGFGVGRRKKCFELMLTSRDFWGVLENLLCLS